MSVPKKFLMVLNHMDWFWSHRLPLVRGILAAGYNLHLAAPGAAADANVPGLGITAHNLPAHGHSINPLSHLGTLWALYRTIRTVKPDIIHAITIRYAFYTALIAKVTGAGPVVLTLAGLGTLFTGNDARSKTLRAIVLPVFTFCFARHDIHIIFQNPDDRRAFLNLGIVREEQTTIIRGSGVDLNEFPLAPEPENETPIVLFSSRLLREKGIEDFVAAARILRHQSIPAKFVVAGGLDETRPGAITRADVDGWVADGFIEYLGNARNMPCVLAASTLVVLPSYYGEGVPKILLEAAATGRAIITCDTPGCREAVADGENGILVPPRRPDALAAAIKTLLSDKPLRMKMGQAGRARMMADFTVDIVVSRTLEIYKNF